MPSAKQVFVNCTKCGTLVNIRVVRRRETYDCPECGEPMRELIEMDKTTNPYSGSEEKPT